MENTYQGASPESDARRLVHALYKAFGNKDISALGRFLGVEPTSEPAWFAAHDFHRVRDGRIVRTDHLEDLFGFLERAGAFPE